MGRARVSRSTKLRRTRRTSYPLPSTVSTWRPL